MTGYSETHNLVSHFLSRDQKWLFLRCDLDILCKIGSVSGIGRRNVLAYPPSLVATSYLRVVFWATMAD